MELSQNPSPVITHALFRGSVTMWVEIGVLRAPLPLWLMAFGLLVMKAEQDIPQLQRSKTSGVRLLWLRFS